MHCYLQLAKTACSQSILFFFPCSSNDETIELKSIQQINYSRGFWMKLYRGRNDINRQIDQKWLKLEFRSWFSNFTYFYEKSLVHWNQIDWINQNWRETPSKISILDDYISRKFFSLKNCNKVKILYRNISDECSHHMMYEVGKIP